ncbi:uncharacterized protein [Watersipora subatra]|uniref:uncharacterized protein n=1 Tax=Watersipora subatra TaxID=2589382 RepID=UPI00355B92F0
MVRHALAATITLLFAASLVASYTYMTPDDVCNYEDIGYQSWDFEHCERCTCVNPKGMAVCVGCGAIDLGITPEQEAAGCTAEWVERSPSLLYPDCCEKYIHCP